MKIVDLKKEHITEARELICSNYDEEIQFVDALPVLKKEFNLLPFADNDFSVIAVDENKIVGVLCSYSPFDNAFGSTKVKGVFSPMGANAAIKNNREKIYAAMYQSVAKRWVKAGAFSLLEYRGKGVTQNLFNYVMKTLKAEGYTMLGVDFESFNPTAYGFWTKYFTPYTHSVVRRIDEEILNTELL